MSLCMLGQACYQFKAFDEAKASLEESLAIGRQIGMPAEDMEIVRKALAMTLAGIGEHAAARRRRTCPRSSRGWPHRLTTPCCGLLEDQERRYKAGLRAARPALAERLCAEAVHTSRELCGGPGKAVVFHLVSHAEFCRQLQWHDKAESLLDEEAWPSSTSWAWTTAGGSARATRSRCCTPARAAPTRRRRSTRRPSRWPSR
jgi:hypothetical protein